MLQFPCFPFDFGTGVIKALVVKIPGIMLKRANFKSVRIMNRVMLTELLKDSNGRVVGAVGISTREPKLLIFQAKSIVINKGGADANRLYPPPHLIGNYGAQLGTGDVLMLAHKAGADRLRILSAAGLREGY